MVDETHAEGARASDTGPAPTVVAESAPFVEAESMPAAGSGVGEYERAIGAIDGSWNRPGDLRCVLVAFLILCAALAFAWYYFSRDGIRLDWGLEQRGAATQGVLPGRHFGQRQAADP